MIEKKRRCAAFAVCGSFCTLETALEQAQELTARGWELLPVMSNTAARCDTRFGRAGSLGPWLLFHHPFKRACCEIHSPSSVSSFSSSSSSQGGPSSSPS